MCLEAQLACGDGRAWCRVGSQESCGCVGLVGLSQIAWPVASVATTYGCPRRLGMGTQNGYGHDRRPCPRHMATPILTRPCPRKIFCLQKIFAEKKLRKHLEIKHLR